MYGKRRDNMAYLFSMHRKEKNLKRDRTTRRWLEELEEEIKRTIIQKRNRITNACSTKKGKRKAVFERTNHEKQRNKYRRR